MHRIYFLGISLLFMTGLSAQQVYISRYIPDYPTNADNPDQEVEIFNDSRSKNLNLKGYILMTRSFILKFPNLEIPPLKHVSLGMKARGIGPYVSILDMPDFQLRTPYGSDQGDFVILLNPNLRPMDAFYFSEVAEVDFLPVRETFVTVSGQEISIRTPAEQVDDWAYLQLAPDPLFSFVKINETWSPSSRKGNIFAATEYRYLQHKYVEGIVSLRWQTRFENDCFDHVIERSSGNRNFVEVGRKSSALQNSSRPLDYEFYDDEVEQNQIYFYRIRHTDKFGETVYSSELEVSTEENPGGFFFDIISEPSDQGRYLNIRFTSRQEQKVRIMLLDEELRQLATLFSDNIHAEKQNLITYRKAIPFGIYHILVETENRRYRELLVVE